MGEETLLSNLCSICNTTKSKYQCPGCAARTCSLPCYKRHQTRALCTGKRDPTKYVKKSQLITPAGIDHDFNFITRIERELNRVEKHGKDKGLGNAPEPQQPMRKGNLKDNDYASAGVNVIRAPKGLSRQKENQSYLTNRKNITWTVEWIREDKTRILTQCLSTESVFKLQPFPTASKKRSNPSSQPSNKQSRDSENVSTLPPDKVRRLNVETGDEKEEPPSPRHHSPGNDQASDDTGEDSRESSSNTEVANALHPSLSLDGSDSKSLPSEYNCFLLRPRTSSSRHVLTPLSSSATLGQSLHGRTVLEFPTIYAFPSFLTQLPEGFMLEEDYVKEEDKEQKEFEYLLKHAQPEILKALHSSNNVEGGNETADHEFDSRKILDVLKQDLGGLL
ncbi:hypothetical protein K504DRAFT_470825 [Pleomassaria siparia CBS 279.74]|uniref:HIT-type domain-containing protein n=1 Tax=Pleomassaria siparia CBS 279.74 TaxID=1314801 RepID=A0A6G1K1S8_9PLEO|nr:hypothetical protein K504DRAFT_470825 [Pleomassaria siparia CBS 279.74]